MTFFSLEGGLPRRPAGAGKSKACEVLLGCIRRFNAKYRSWLHNRYFREKLLVVKAEDLVARPEPVL